MSARGLAPARVSPDFVSRRSPRLARKKVDIGSGHPLTPTKSRSLCKASSGIAVPLAEVSTRVSTTAPGVSFERIRIEAAVGGTPGDSSTIDEVFVVPGNPGVPGFYERFAQTLWRELNGAAAVEVVGYVGHTEQDVGTKHTKWFTLGEQVEHVTAEIVGSGGGNTTKLRRRGTQHRGGNRASRDETAPFADNASRRFDAFRVDEPEVGVTEFLEFLSAGPAAGSFRGRLGTRFEKNTPRLFKKSLHERHGRLRYEKHPRLAQVRIGGEHGADGQNRVRGAGGPARGRGRLRRGFETTRRQSFVSVLRRYVLHFPNPASLIAHTRLTLSFIYLRRPLGADVAGEFVRPEIRKPGRVGGAIQ